jgi:xanthine/uracil permease
MLYTWATALGRDQTAVVLGWMIGIVAIGILGVARRYGDNAGWVGVASLLAGKTMHSSLAWAYIDWIALLYGLGLIIALDVWRERRRLKDTGLTGAMAGAAIGCLCAGDECG